MPYSHTLRVRKIRITLVALTEKGSSSHLIRFSELAP